MPHIPIIGAYMTMRSIMVVTICICCTSLVQRVISDAEENLPISALEKLITFRNSFPLRSRPTEAPIRAAKKDATAAAINIISAIRNILPPSLHRYCF